MSRRWGWVAAAGVTVALAAGLVSAGATGARAADAGAYADSVDRALQILRDARADDSDAARRAADILEAGTGGSQPEILLDLRQDPPDVADARDRLSALSRAARSRAFAPDPGRARTAVRDILAQPRYADLRQGPSLGDRIRDALLQVLVWVLERIGGVVASGLGWLLAAASTLALALAGALVVRSVRWRRRREARAGVRVAAGQAPPDRFAEADRLATAGDLGGAVRALAGAVAVALGGDSAWEASPLTVREIFSVGPHPAALRPLLLAFEEAVYGDRPPDAEAYGRAAAAAARHRPQRSAAA
ncbi:MAG TPA: DUF4129 domain-containing protein [Candidatus Dormibacteraeota bacterium]